jgi:hypothetical protein
MQAENSVTEFEQRLFTEIDLIKRYLFQKADLNNVNPKWIPRKDVMRFFSYGDTQMAALEKTGELTVTKIGKRKFIHKDSISRLLDKNILNQP